MSVDNLLWAEKYRPSTLDDMIISDDTKKMVRDSIAGGNIPNMVLYGSAGTGKTSVCRVIANELGADLLYINASMERSIDVIRDRVTSFSSTVSFSGGPKIVLFDECLSENESVRVGTVDNWVPVKLNELEKDRLYPIVSFNMSTGELENDTGHIISDKTDELFEVTLASGEKIVANAKHPFICEKDGNFFERTIEQGLIGYRVVRQAL